MSQTLQDLMHYSNRLLEAFCEPDLLENFRKFIDWLNYKGASKNTIKSYINDFKQSTKFLSQICEIEKLTIEQLTSLDLHTFRQLLASLHAKSARTQERLIATWKKWAKFQQHNNVKLAIDFEKIQYPKIQKKVFAHINNDDMQKLLKLPLNSWQDYRLQAFIMLIYATGLRINEALNLKWIDIQGPDEKKYCKIIGKGSKLRFVPILQVAIEALNEYKSQLLMQHPLLVNEYIFLGTKLKKWHACAAEKTFKNALIDLGLSSELSPHSIRHACATHLLKSGCNLRSIQTLLGHSSLETTKIYIQHSTQELHAIHSKIIK